MGRFTQAQENYEAVLRLSPGAVGALCGMAELKKFKAGDPLFAQIEARLAANGLGADDAALLHHAYAKMCNDAGRYDDAFHHFATSKSLHPPTFDIERHCAAYSAMKELFSETFFEERRGWGLTDERPVFIVGMPRSGTTLTEQILASHPLAEGLGELPDLPVLIAERCGPLEDTARFIDAVSSLTREDVEKMAERYRMAYASANPGSLRLVDKRPHNYEWLGLIALMFPKAHIIHCRRDALDTCVSIYMQDFAGNHGYNRHLTTLGRYYHSYVMLMEHWSRVMPLGLHEFVYEAAVADFEPSVRALLDFVGLEWDDRCLDYHQQDRRVSTPSRWQVRQPLYGSSVGRWRNYEKHLGPLRVGLGLD
jgi:tetratricopeptide (TPR) repeat protein